MTNGKRFELTLGVVNLAYSMSVPFNYANLICMVLGAALIAWSIP